MSNSSPLHTIDLIRKKRDGEALSDQEISFLVTGAASGSIPSDQLAAWLMAPYWAWVTFAALLNGSLWRRNRGARGGDETHG